VDGDEKLKLLNRPTPAVFVTEDEIALGADAEICVAADLGPT